MKYLTFLATVVLSLHSAHADQSSVRGLQVEDDEDGLRESITSFLNNTSNLIQSIEVPTLGGLLTTLTCDDDTLVEASCNLLGGVQGVNVCRPLPGGINITVCAPKVLGNYIGTPADTCGCCGGNCYTSRNECPCTCQDGRGVMVNHNIFKVFSRQVSWKACYTPTIAANIMNARPEFGCWTGCEAEGETDEAEDETDEAEGETDTEGEDVEGADAEGDAEGNITETTLGL